MNNLLKIITIVIFPISLNGQVDLINKVSNNGETDTKQFEFTTIYDIEATEVKNQGRSGTCWSYSSTAFLESELIRMGKPVIDLSEMYTVRKVYEDKARKYIRLHGHLNFAQGGALPDLFYLSLIHI